MKNAKKFSRLGWRRKNFVTQEKNTVFYQKQGADKAKACLSIYMHPKSKIFVMLDVSNIITQNEKKITTELKIKLFPELESTTQFSI